MNFMFSWQEQYLTCSLCSLVRYCSCHSNIKFISSRHRVIFSIYASSSGPRLSLFSEVSYCRWHWLMYMRGERHLWQQLCCWWNLKQKINVFGAYARVPPNLQSAMKLLRHYGATSIHNPSLSPPFLGCLLFTTGSLNSGTTLHGGGGEWKLHFPFLTLANIWSPLRQGVSATWNFVADFWLSTVLMWW